MKRLIRLGTMLCLVVMALCTVVIVSGRSQPGMALDNGVSWCEGKPCFLGIVPGQTLWAEAQTLLMDHKPEVGEDGIALTVASADVLLTPSKDGSTVDTIFIHDPELRLNAVLARFGTPCNITISPGSLVNGAGIALAVAPYVIANVHLPPGFDFSNPILGQESRVPELWLTGGMDVCQIGRYRIRERVQRPWAGFAALRKYVR